MSTLPEFLTMLFAPTAILGVAAMVAIFRR